MSKRPGSGAALDAETDTLLLACWRVLETARQQATPSAPNLEGGRKIKTLSAAAHQPGQIQQAVRRWAERQRRRRRATGLDWSEALFVQTAMVWLRFLGRLEERPSRPAAYALRLQWWATVLADRDGLSPRAITKYQWWARQLGSHLARQSVRLRDLTLAQVDAFLGHLGRRGLSRASMVTAARSLRRCFQYAYQQGWCRKDLAAGVLAPRLFRHEDLPQGPSWTDVQRLLAATDTDRPGDIRNRAIFWRSRGDQARPTQSLRGGAFMGNRVLACFAAWGSRERESRRVSATEGNLSWAWGGGVSWKQARLAAF